MPLILVLTCTERELCFFFAGDFFCRLCWWAVFSPSSLSYILITATFGRVGFLGLTGVGSGNGVSEVSVDMELSAEELSALSLDSEKHNILLEKNVFNWSCQIFISVIHMGYWPSLFGQDGWILAKFFFCVLMDRDKVEVHKLAKETRPISSHLDRTNLVNKGFIIWLLGKFFFRDTAGSPERAKWLHLPHLGSQITARDLGHLARSRS